MNEVDAHERRAAVLNLQGIQTATIHTAMFMQLLVAKNAGDERLANFYLERLPPDFREAYDAWLAQKPFDNPNAAPHPFTPQLYEMRGTREAAAETAKAARNVDDARRAGTVSGQYLANTVLFATVLFFASTAVKFEQRRVHLSMAAFAVGGFLFAVARTVMLPR